MQPTSFKLCRFTLPSLNTVEIEKWPTLSVYPASFLLWRCTRHSSYSVDVHGLIPTRYTRHHSQSVNTSGLLPTVNIPELLCQDTEPNLSVHRPPSYSIDVTGLIRRCTRPHYRILECVLPEQLLFYSMFNCAMVSAGCDLCYSMLIVLWSLLVVICVCNLCCLCYGRCWL